MYNHTQLFLTVDFRYLRSTRIYEGRVDDGPSLVIELKSWWWSASFNPSIFHILLVHYTMLFATELLPIAIGIDSTFGSKVKMHSRKLVCILVF